MRNTWTRERIIRHIIERQAEGRPMTIGGKGIDHQLYSAARRIFGSWRNAILAAGISPNDVLAWERWSPDKVLAKIRVIARRRRPLAANQRERGFRNLVSAARRYFGSWSKAVLAAGVDPTRLQRIVPWNRDRVIEAILVRALRNDSLAARLVEPRSLVEAGQRYFGNWVAAVTAAGLDPTVTELPRRRTKRPRPRTDRIVTSASASGRLRVWSQELIVEAIRARLRDLRPLNSSAVSRDHSALYLAARRHLRSWDNALRAAGLDPGEYRRLGGGASGATEARTSATTTRTSQHEDVVRPDQSA